MNRCNAMPEAISSGLVLQQRLGSDEQLVAWEQERRLVVVVAHTSSRRHLRLHFGGTPHHFRLSILRRARDVLNFDHFSCLFVWSVSSRASGATTANKEKIRRPRDIVCIINLEIPRLQSGFFVATVSSKLVHRQELCSIIRSCSFG